MVPGEGVGDILSAVVSAPEYIQLFKNMIIYNITLDHFFTKAKVDAYVKML